LVFRFFNISYLYFSGSKSGDYFGEPSPLLPRSRTAQPLSAGAPPPPASKSLHHLSKAARNGYAVPHKTFPSDRDIFTVGGPPGGHSFSDLESTRIDFDESITTPSTTTTTATSYNNNTAQHNQTLESDNNSDIVIEEKKLVSSDDFKIVFISSESKSGSELNSSLECTEEAPPSKTTTMAAADDQLRHVTGDYIDEMDWVNYQKKVHPRGHHQKAARRLSDSPRLSDKKRSPRLLPDPDRRCVEYRLYICRTCRGSVIISPTFTVFNQIDDFGIVFPAVSRFYISLNFLEGCR
jgi:hypothetical protein